MLKIARKIRKKLLPAREARNNVPLPETANYSPTTELFNRIKDIPGWFTFDDCAHFSMILGFQKAMGISGDILEIGAYYGRSAAVLARHLKSGETLLLCDLFEEGDSNTYGDCPTPEKVLVNITSVNPDISTDNINFVKGDSSKLTLAAKDKFRFVHVDGGHGYDECLSDLELCVDHVVYNGIIVVDDYMHPDWPEVTYATNDFLKKRADIEVVADLNRATAIGRKLYLLRKL